MTIKCSSLLIHLAFGSLLITLLACDSVTHTNTIEKQSYIEFRAAQKSFITEHGTMRYVDAGQSDHIILLLHGVPSSSWLYRKMIDGLVAAGYRVIAPDMLGFGSSDNPDGYDIYSPQQHAKRILALMDELAIDSWTHVMHDAGGVWTWALADLAPEKIDNLVILNTIILPEGFHPPVRMKPGAAAKAAMALYRQPTSSTPLLNQLFVEGLQSNTISKEAFNGYQTPLLEGKTQGMYQFFTNTCNTLPDYSAILQSLKIPVAVIWGNDDEILRWPAQSARVMELMNIDVDDVHIINAGHFLQEESPEQVNAHILAFLAKTGA